MPIAFIIGLGAGLASAALFASAWTGTALGVLVLFFLSPLPVAIAGLGWGWACGALAATVGMAIVAVAGGGRSGLVYLIALGAPAAVFSYFAMLNRSVPADGSSRDGGEGSVVVEWYPVGRIVAWASLWAGLTAAVSMLSVATDVAMLRAVLLEVFEKSSLFDGLGQSGKKLTNEEKNAFVAVMTVFFPWAIATMWFAVATLNLWLAANITHRSGRLARPWPDLSALQLPPAMPLAFGIAILGTFASGMPGLVASGFASALMFAFMLAGLAILHRVSRGHSMRPMLLGLVYSSLMFLSPFSTLLIAMLGLAEPYLRRRIPPGAQPPPNMPT